MNELIQRRKYFFVFCVLLFMTDNKNPILTKSFDFALLTVSFCQELQTQKNFVIANQLLKSGTSIGANVREAQHAESKSDFIHKLKIASKECEETIYWLEICKASYSLNCDTLLSESQQIGKLLSRIISTAKRNS
jgi:four helix bundle protein